MSAQIVRVGKYFINLNNIAYAEMVTSGAPERTTVHVNFVGSEESFSLREQPAIDLMNFLESIKE
jgi:hypothetical protein